MSADALHQQEQEGPRNGRTAPLGWWLTHVALTVAVAVVALAIARGRHGLRSVEIAGWVVAVGGTVASGLIQGPRAGGRKSFAGLSLSYATFAAGLLCLIAARLMASEAASIAFAVSGMALALAACALFVKDIRAQRQRPVTHADPETR